MTVKKSFILLAFAAVIIGIVNCDEPAAAAAASVVKPNIKIYIEKPVVQEIPPDQVNPDDIIQAIPIEKNQPPAVEVESPKKEVDVKEQQEQQAPELPSVHLEPMPILFPSILSQFPPLPPFLKKIFENRLKQQQQQQQQQQGASNQTLDSDEDDMDDSEDDNEIGDSIINSQDPIDKSDSLQNGPHGFMSIFLFKSNRNQLADGSDNDQAESNDEQSSIGGNVKHSILIMKILPRPTGLLGGESDPDNGGIRKTIHIFGGASDPDSPLFMSPNKINFFGGPGDLADHMIGQDDLRMNEMQQPHESILSKIKNFFSFMHPAHQQQEDNIMMQRDDSINPEQQPTEGGKKKCMMMSFMRLKASAYYRTIIHLLFFSGLALFVLFAGLLTMRMVKSKRQFRYRNNQNMQLVSSIQDKDILNNEKTGKSKFYWLNNTGSGIIESPTTEITSSPLLMPPPPPAYDQVEPKHQHHNHKTGATSSTKSAVRSLSSSLRNSSLINSLATAYKSRYSSIKPQAVASQDSNLDAKSIKSLPPDYEETRKDQQNI